MPPPTNSHGLRGVVDAASSGSGGSVDAADADGTDPDAPGELDDSSLALAAAGLLVPGDGGVLVPGAAVAPDGGVGVGDAGRNVGRGVAVGGGFDVGEGVGRGVGRGVGAAVGDGVGAGVGLGAVTTTVGPARGSTSGVVATNVTGQEPAGRLLLPVYTPAVSVPDARARWTVIPATSARTFVAGSPA